MGLLSGISKWKWKKQQLLRKSVTGCAPGVACGVTQCGVGVSAQAYQGQSPAFVRCPRGCHRKNCLPSGLGKLCLIYLIYMFIHASFMHASIHSWILTQSQGIIFSRYLSWLAMIWSL